MKTLMKLSAAMTAGATVCAMFCAFPANAGIINSTGGDYAEIPAVSGKGEVGTADAAGINVAYHTQDEIRTYFNAHPFSYTGDETYDSNGTPDDQAEQNAINCLNYMRYIAGLDEVTLNASYLEQAQAASIVIGELGYLSHSPSQPDTVSDEIYARGAQGAGRSNLAMYSRGWGSRAAFSVVMYMSDSDSSNIDCVGHRRWCLNAPMKQTAFGFYQSGYYYYSAMYAIDGYFNSADRYGVCWPAQNTPTDVFGYYDDDAWSISMGYTVDASAVKVTLTRVNDGRTWTFSQASSDGDFYVDNQGYGQSGCIIFRPDDASHKQVNYDAKRYHDGEVYQVTIEGLQTPVSYTVNFFDIEGGQTTTTTTTTTTVQQMTEYDLNGNGTTDLADAVFLLRCIAEENPTGISRERLSAADLDDDGSLTLLDVRTLLNLLQS